MRGGDGTHGLHASRCVRHLGNIRVDVLVRMDDIRIDVLDTLGTYAWMY